MNWFGVAANFLRDAMASSEPWNLGFAAAIVIGVVLVAVNYFRN
jgi:hypothetical protein